jgi:hypothetical protein
LGGRTRVSNRQHVVEGQQARMGMSSRTHLFDQFVFREIRDGADLVLNPAFARATANRAVANERSRGGIRTDGFNLL